MKPTRRVFSTRFVVALLLASLSYAGSNVALGQWPGGGDSTSRSGSDAGWPGGRPAPTQQYVPPNADKFVCSFNHARRDRAMESLRIGSSGKPLCPSRGTNYGNYFSDDRISELSDLIRSTGVREDRIIVLERPGYRNAAAVQCEAADGEIKQLIMWGPEFLSEMDRDARTKWASVAILAHELAHHHNNDTGQNPGRIPAHERMEQELFAERWAGQKLREFGASRDEAVAVFRLMGEGGDTHPPARKRVAAAGDGWDRASGRSGRISRPAPGRGNYPSPTPIPAPRTATGCATQFGICPIFTMQPMGTPCGCPTMMGVLPGIAQ